MLAKLVAYGVKGPLLDWIAAFLRNRSQCVCVDDCLSQFISVKSGVPQGSVLGPILFILFVNDITDVCVGSAKGKLYADDLKMYSSVDINYGYSLSLQNSLNNLMDWSVKWQLPINANKCFILSLHRSKSVTRDHDYHIGDIVLLRRSYVEDLGIEYDSTLNFDRHIDNIVSSARAKVGLLFRGFKTRDPDILKRAFVTYIRPKLDYASNVWNPYLKTNIVKLESVQRYFTKRIKTLSSFSYGERLARLNLETLENRRLKADLVSYYKIFHGLSVFSPNYFDVRTSLIGTRSKTVYLCKNIDGTQACYFAFFNRGIDCWNSLPANVSDVDSLSVFKNRLDTIELSHFCCVLD